MHSGTDSFTRVSILESDLEVSTDSGKAADYLSAGFTSGQF